MTSPIAPVAPTGTPLAPTPATIGSPYEGMDVMERTLAETIDQSRELLGLEGQGEPGELLRDAQGRFLPRAAAAAPPADGTAAPAPPPVVVPEGHVLPPALAPEKVQGFRVLDAEGELVPPDLTFEVNFRGPNGTNQPRLLDVPQLVNYARMGVYNHQREQAATQTAAENQALQARLAQADQHRQQLERDRDLLLSDPDFLMKSLQQYEQENTPEARDRKAREEIELQRHYVAYEAAGRENDRWLDERAEPALQTITEFYPSVTPEELGQQLLTLARPFMVPTPFGHILHPSAHRQLAQAVMEQLAPWAEQLHQAREATFRRSPAAPAARPAPAAPAPTPDADTAALQVRAQRARRVATAAVQPPGGTGVYAPTAPPTAPPTGNRDQQDWIVARTLAQTRGG